MSCRERGLAAAAEWQFEVIRQRAVRRLVVGAMMQLDVPIFRSVLGSHKYKQQNEQQLSAASIHHQKPVFTIGKAPLVAGTIVHRNYLRAQKQNTSKVRWSVLTPRLLFSRTTVKK